MNIFFVTKEYEYYSLFFCAPKNMNIFFPFGLHDAHTLWSTCKSRNCEVRRLMWSPPRSESLAELRFFFLFFTRICTLPRSSMQAIASPFLFTIIAVFFICRRLELLTIWWYLNYQKRKKIKKFQDLIFLGIYCLRASFNPKIHFGSLNNF